MVDENGLANISSLENDNVYVILIDPFFFLKGYLLNVTTFLNYSTLMHATSITASDFVQTDITLMF